MEYDNTNKGTLFANKKKKTERHPDYTGQINIAGTDHWLSAWIVTPKSGKKFLSLSLGDVKENREPAARQQEANNEITVDEIPF